jgi:uncharacterized membrane protein
MFNEISAFIQKYYIDAVMQDQPYNIYETVTYALILIAALYFVYRWLKRTGIRIDTPFILATIPYVVFGGIIRVVEDTGMVPAPWWVLLVTPLIYFVIFFYTVIVLLVSRFLEGKGYTASYTRPYMWGGILASLFALVLYIWWGFAETELAFWVAACILLMAGIASALIWALLKYGFSWEYVSHPLYKILIAGHFLDASATSFGLDLHPMHYIEQHVLGGNLIEMTGTAFVMFPLKIAVLLPAIWIMEQFRKEEGMDQLWHLVMLAMITVGLAPGIRDMMRMVLFV